ncbi:MAG: hypothetical protein HYV27_12840 [Candidatus Hydrogenedentes bacterium]|nr:hypothetical protein [Candidatus Hydrogenedentota bacterium]
MALWTVFFCAGLLPVETFYLLRDLGMVLTQSALVNSFHLVGLSLAAYMGFFVYFRCREEGLDAPEAQGKALQLGVVALVAFLPLPFQQIVDVSEMPTAYFRYLTIGIAVLKVWCWLYLYLLLLVYYVLNHAAVFTGIHSWFPSTHAAHQEKGPVADRVTPAKAPSNADSNACHDES